MGEGLGWRAGPGSEELNRHLRVVGLPYTDASDGTIRPVATSTYDSLGNLATVAAGRIDNTGDHVTTLPTYVIIPRGLRLGREARVGTAGQTGLRGGSAPVSPVYGTHADHRLH